VALNQSLKCGLTDAERQALAQTVSAGLIDLNLLLLALR
jgi:hypothetical protein